MRVTSIMKLFTVAFASAILPACKDDVIEPSGRASGSPSAAIVAGALPEAFTARAALPPFFINQPSQVMMRTDAVADFGIQRLVTAPGIGGWHTHPGPSFGIVERGQVMITRVTKAGCVSTVYGPGQAYYEVANEVHRATVLAADTAVEYKARFYTPAGQPFGNPAADPGCTS
jgi:hypothetical protein